MSLKQRNKYIRNVAKYCNNLGGKFYHVPGKFNIFSSHGRKARMEGGEQEGRSPTRPLSTNRKGEARPGPGRIK